MIVATVCKKGSVPWTSPGEQAPRHYLWLKMRYLLPLLLALFTPLAAADLSIPTIVIDAGHGGTDLGARGRNPYCEEKKLALATARLVKKYLAQLGYHVVMTRSTDEFLSLERRVEIANRSNSDLFVSIHYNSSSTPSAKGVEVFFCESKALPKRAASSCKAAQTVLARVVRRTKSISRGVKKGNFHVIRETRMPAILVEGGFISNPQERSCLKDPFYLEQIARGVAEGVDAYFR